MTAHLIVIAPGLGASVQDVGRPGYQALGVPPSGALDPVVLQIANWLTGNDGGAGAIEMRFSGPEFEVAGGPVRVAVAGEGAQIALQPSGGRVSGYRSTTLQAGQRFRLELRGGAPCYLAVAGGFAVTPVLGSLSTLSVAQLGGFCGRALAAGDVLPVNGLVDADTERILRPPNFPVSAALRVIFGPQDDYFAPEALAQFLSESFTASPRFDRMGLRLEGPALRHVKGADIVSDGNAPGSVQVPGSGQPIILLADRGTTGGYPKIATVITADFPQLGRISPGDTVRFVSVSHVEAVAALRAHRAWMKEVRRTIRPCHAAEGGLAQALAAENIISGVTDGTCPEREG